MKNGELVQNRLQHASKSFPLRKVLSRFKSVLFYPLPSGHIEVYVNENYKGTLTRPYVVSVLRSLNLQLSNMIIDSKKINRMF